MLSVDISQTADSITILVPGIQLRCQFKQVSNAKKSLDLHKNLETCIVDVSGEDLRLR